MEEFRRIPGFPDYEVSNHGNVRSYRKSETKVKLLKPYFNQPKSERDRGRLSHLMVSIYDADNEKNCYLVHRLVMLAFIGPCPNGYECLHIDGNPMNNRLDNLRYGTRRENINDSIKHGTHCWSKPFTKKHREKLSDACRSRASMVKYMRVIESETGVAYDVIDKICLRLIELAGIGG